MTEKKKLTVSERQARWRAQNLERSREIKRVWQNNRRNPDKTPIIPMYKDQPTHFQSIKAVRDAERKEKRRIANANRAVKKPTEASIRAKKDVKRWLARDQGLDIDMIIPSFIPKGYCQSFDFRTMSYYLESDRRYNRTVST